MDIYTYIGCRIRKARLENSMSLADLSKEFGCSKSTLSELERGIIRFNLNDLDGMAQILEKPVSYFLPPEWIYDIEQLPERISFLIESLNDIKDKKTRDEIAHKMALLVQSFNENPKPRINLRSRQHRRTST